MGALYVLGEIWRAPESMGEFSPESVTHDPRRKKTALYINFPLYCTVFIS